MQRIEDCGCRVYIWSAVWWLFIILWGFKKGGKTMSCCLIPTLVCVISWEYFSLNVSLSHCTNILYSLEFYTSSQPTMSTSTGTQKNDNQFIEDWSISWKMFDILQFRRSSELNSNSCRKNGISSWVKSLKISRNFEGKVLSCSLSSHQSSVSCEHNVGTTEQSTVKLTKLFSLEKICFRGTLRGH